MELEVCMVFSNYLVLTSTWKSTHIKMSKLYCCQLCWNWVWKGVHYYRGFSVSWSPKLWKCLVVKTWGWVALSFFLLQFIGLSAARPGLCCFLLPFIFSFSRVDGERAKGPGGVAVLFPSDLPWHLQHFSTCSGLSHLKIAPTKKGFWCTWVTKLGFRKLWKGASEAKKPLSTLDC